MKMTRIVASGAWCLPTIWLCLSVVAEGVLDHELHRSWFSPSTPKVKSTMARRSVLLLGKDFELDEAKEGRASFYSDFTETFCYGRDHTQFLPGTRITALRKSLFSPSMCGKCLLVKCKRGTQNDGNPCKDSNSVVVKIADRCDGSCDGDLDMAQSAFDAIAKESEGVIVVDYESVPCS